jgi:hypothetical protein
MSRRRKHKARPRAHGHLLILGCSDRKRQIKGKLPAIELYDGVNFRVLRHYLNANGWPPGLRIKVLSAKYGLIDSTDLVEPYNERLDKNSARRLNASVLKALRSVEAPSSVFVNLGKDYLRAIEGIDQLFKKRIKYASGGIGCKMAQMKGWLTNLPGKTATITSRPSRRSYLYFFPDWDDYVSHPFIHETTNNALVASTTKKYAHQVFGADKAPYDGLLVSLAQMYTGKGILSRLNPNTVGRSDLRNELKIPRRLLLFGDCGAFSYAGKDKPPFSAEEAARLYHRFGFDVGASVDHIPLEEIVVENDDGKVTRRALSDQERRQRMKLTARNADAFLHACRRHRYRFLPIGVIQGLDAASYVNYVHKYIDMGYQHIALGGLVPRTDSDILGICAAVRDAIQRRTRTVKENVWLHLFGIFRPKLQQTFRLLGVSSFDSASYLRKAWLRSDQNYLSADGSRWYSTIRVPISSSKRLREAARSKRISAKRLTALENRCLVALNNFDGTESAHQEVVNSVNEYGPLLVRRGEDNHFFEKHNEVLTDRPWEACRCQVCRHLGIDVVVFRGSGRNKRRGFHNTWVLYHKILHGN